ncbi:hypothetical protein CR51_04760 [Caballeronia megalochromosomata]|nr:hypothetical protein CR51_04760 [Caballeronia megalochromosomata]
MIASRFDPAAKNTQWHDLIKKRESLKILLVINSATAELNRTALQSLIAVTYQDKSPETGVLEKYTANLEQEGSGSIFSSIKKLVVFFGAFVVSALVTVFFVLIFLLFNLIKNRRKQPPGSQKPPVP